jgi:DNA-binding SARP family transcriptional activator
VTGPVVGVLGAVTVRAGGRPVGLRGRRTRELLARLVSAGGQVVSADRLVEDLWAGAPPPNAAAALQVHVSYARRALEPDREPRAPARVLVSAAPGYALRLPAEAVDAWRFERLAGRAAGIAAAYARRAVLAEALACWSGGAYAEFADAAWAQPERTRLEDLRRATVEALAAADLALGDATRAVAGLEPLLAADPAREETARLLATALYRSGRQADALAVARRVREHLAAELGVDPSPVLRELEADLLRQAPALDPPVIPRPPAAPDRMVGRDAELAALLAAAGTAAGTAAGVDGGVDGGVRLVWVAGEAGTGKSTLLAAAARRLARTGWTVLRGRCPETDDAPPGWAWQEVADGLGVPFPTGLGPFRLARELGGRLAAAAGERPHAVLIEDAHLADDLTAQLVRQVAEAAAGAPVLLVVTYRPSEQPAGLAAVRAATAAVTAAHLRLAGLDRGAVDALARSAGLVPDGPALDLLAERTGGNPLFVRELARLMASRGRAEAAAAVPDGVADVLRARADRLPASAAVVLREAAVLGGEVDVDVLAEVFGRDPDDVLDALEAPLLAGLVVDAGAGRVRFDHALVRDTFYADVPPLRRARWHAAALAVLERRTPDAVDALARHALAGLRPATAATAVGYATAAADRALAVGAAATAAALYRQALAAADLLPPDVPARVRLRAAAVRALARAGDVLAGRALQREAVRLAGDDLDLLRLVLTAWDAPLIWTTRALGEADDVLLAATTRLLAVTPPGPDRARLLCAHFLEVENRDDDAALAASAEALALALALARSVGDDRLLCAALNIRAYAALGPDLAAEREPLARELVAAAAGHADYQAAGHWLAFLAAAARGDLLAARPEVDAAVTLAAGGQLAGLLSVLAAWEATLDLLAGRVDSGLARWVAVTDQLVAYGSPNATAMALVGPIVAGFAAGDMAGLADDLRHLTGTSTGALTVLALLDAGRTAEARTVFAGLPPVERGFYWLGLTAARAHAAARLTDRPAAAALYAELLPWSGRVAGLDSGTMPLGPVDDALAACATALGDPAAARTHRAAAAAVRADLAAQLTQLGR